MRYLRDLLWRIGYGRGPVWMSTLRKRWVVLRHPRATIRFGEHSHVGPGFSLHIPAGGSFIVGPGVEFRRGFRAEIEGDGRIEIGAGCVFTYYVLIQCTTSIEFGERVMVGQSSMIADGGHRFRDLDKPMLSQGYDYEPIRIGDDVTIFSKVTIVSQIGQRSAIAANAVVTRPIPPYTLAGGVPARELESLKPDSEEASSQA